MSIFGFTGPEYFGFGTIVTLPDESNLVRCHGPSTTCQRGFVAYVLSELFGALGFFGSKPDCLERYSNTFSQDFASGETGVTFEFFVSVLTTTFA